MRRRVLIISPHFPPINAPDHQRVRMSLPYFREFGWEPHILTVRPECVEGVDDPLLGQTVPEDVAIAYVNALPVKYTKYFGLSNLGWRCLPYLAATGQKLLKQKTFDLIYFSNTVFLTMGLAPFWWKQFGVPYVLDFQDPWLSDYYKNTEGAAPPPGGKFKYGFAQFLARNLEPQAMRHVSHITSVSPSYPKTLLHRYPWLKEEQFTVLPFGAAERDFELLPNLNVQQKIFDPQDGKRHWVYVGRGGSDMALALRALFLAIQSERDRDPVKWQALKLHFVGTSYATGERAVKTVEAIAQECGVADLVEEYPQRVPYFEALQILVNSDAILLIGSDDPGYTASKIYPCVLARKPILAVFHQQSSVVSILRSCNAAQVITFTGNEQPSDLTKDLSAQVNYLLNASKGQEPSTNWQVFQPYTARHMTEQLCHAFNQCLSSSY